MNNTQLESHRAIAGFIALVGLFVVPMSAATAAAIGGIIPVGDHATLMKAFQQVGWRTRMDADGELVLSYQGIKRKAPQPHPDNSLDRMGELLAQRGWSVQRETDGSLILTPRTADTVVQTAQTVEVADVETPTPSIKESLPAANWQTLVRQLEVHGWHTQQGKAGSLLFFPADLTTPEASHRSAQIATSPQSPQPTGNHWASLVQRLEQAGWNTALPDDGSLLFSPRQERQEVLAATVQSTKPIAAFNAVTRKPSLFHEQLRSEGWHTAEDADGTLWLFPKSKAAA